MVRVAAAVLAALLGWQCSSENETTPAVADCAAAVAAFTANIQPHIKADSCAQSSCHAGGQKPDLRVGKHNAASNRGGMLAEAKDHDGWLAGDTMWKWLNSNDHPGRDQLGGLTAEKITTWVAAERACE